MDNSLTKTPIEKRSRTIKKRPVRAAIADPRSIGVKISQLPPLTTLTGATQITTLAGGINYRSPLSAVAGAGLFDTMAAAQAADLTSVNAVRTAGFSAAGDGGEGIYKVQSTAPVAPAIGFQAPAAPAIAGRWIVLAGDRINLRAMGASLLAADDQTDYLQDAVNTNKPVFIPAGTVKISQSILYSIYLNIEGIGSQFPGVAGIGPSIISGDLPTPLIHRPEVLIVDDYPNPPDIVGDPYTAGGGSRFALRHLTMQNFMEKAPGISPSCVQVYNSVCPVTIDHCLFNYRYRAVEMIQPFTASLSDCRFNSDWASKHNVLTEDFRDAVGLIGLQCRAFNCEFIGGGTGVRFFGAASLYGGRIEVSGCGAHLGDRAIHNTGTNTAYSWQGVVEGVSFEANHVSIDAVTVTDARIANCSVQSSVNGPARFVRADPPLYAPTVAKPYAGLGDWGMTVSNGTAGSIIEGIMLNGSFMKYAYDIKPAYYGTVRGVSGINLPIPNETPARVRPVGIHKTNMSSREIITTKVTKTFFDIDLYDKAAALTPDSDRFVSHIGNLRLSTLQQIDNTKPPVIGRNLAGTLPVANGATSATMTFLAGGAGEGTAQFTGALPNPSAVAQIGSSLAPGTYYYATTIVGPRGETGVSGVYTNPPVTGGLTYRSVVIAADQKASMTFTAIALPMLRRVYRGQELGQQFDGFWETALGTFVDDGTQAFDGYSYPPATGASVIVPSHIEPDTNYYVQVQPTWATTWHVSAKSTTAFTITFGTAAPSAQTVGWLMYRP